MIRFPVLYAAAAVLSMAVYFFALAILDAERRGIAQKLLRAARGEESLADTEERDGDTVHAATRRQNAWAFRAAAKQILTGAW